MRVVLLSLVTFVKMEQKNKEKKKTLLIIGPAGHGRSSVVNLLLGAVHAKVGEGASNTTLQVESYSNEKYILIDTPGWSTGDSDIFLSLVSSKKQQTGEEWLAGITKELRQPPDLILVVRMAEERLWELQPLLLVNKKWPKVPRLFVLTKSESYEDFDPPVNKEDFFTRYGFQDIVGICSISPMVFP